jgi:hypothetical protein
MTDVATTGALRRLTLKRPHDALQIGVALDNAEDEQWFLLTSDRHFDNSASDHDLQRLHLDQALERDAAIIDIGDLFDAMQGPGDRRSERSQIRREEDRFVYFNQIVDEAATFFEPYAEQMIMLSRGNHETAPIRHYGLDLTQWLATALKGRVPDCPLRIMPYDGFIKLSVTVSGQRRGGFTGAYVHGSGGGGKVTKGAIQSQRRHADFDCDFFLSGHTHDEYVMHRYRYTLNSAGKIYNKRSRYISIPGYKRSTEKHDGFEAEKEHGPKGVGAYWLRVYVGKNGTTPKYQVSEADEL